MPKIILATIGSLGDLYPFIAMARALQGCGVHPVLAVPEDHVAKAQAAGIEAVAVLPSFATLCRRTGLDEGEAARRIIASQREMLEQVILPDLSSCAEKLDALAADADAIVSSAFFLAAPIVAEKRGLPLVSIVLQPMALLSAQDPPNTPDFWMMKRTPGRIGAQWNRSMFATLRQIIDQLYGRKIDRVRREHGLAAAGAARMFEGSKATVLTLGCYSPSFAALPRDAPANAALVGFPMFDGSIESAEPLDPALEAFLAAGPPPLVFTLGTFVVHAPTRFYETAAAAAQRLGMRAVLLTGGAELSVTDETIFACNYAPHSRLFPRAAAIIHHGGIGTTGQALRAGKPQLVVPHMGDQNDHAVRISRLGIGRRLAPRRFRPARVASLLADMLLDSGMMARAADIAAGIAAEHSPMAAANAILAAVGIKPQEAVDTSANESARTSALVNP